MASEPYNFKDIEAKWQKVWQEQEVFKTTDEATGEKMYVLDMFPYPSGDGLHVGHVKIYTASDIVSRYLRMRGFNVLHPTGWDAFGLPTENSAIKSGIHPAKLTERNIARFRQQMQRVGLSYDWDREINTTDPFYYKWTQWIFLQLYRMGLAYQDTVPINWCPSCKTGLANEEVVAGKCERCGTLVEQKPMKQWLLKITRYADHLLQGLDGLDWPESIVEQQRNWIGRSEGATILFALENAPLLMAGKGTTEQQAVEVFTTRSDTLYGATYLVLSPEHPLVEAIVTDEQRAAVHEYQEKVRYKTELERTDLAKAKTGVFTGAYALHPITEERVPVWIADYVLMSYGTGAIMAVPAHDERDYEFAQTFNLPIKSVIEPSDVHQREQLPYTGDGILVDSGKHNGQTSVEARRHITEQLQVQGRGRRAVKYKLRDWVFSRQRYWGEPIPILHCEKCGTVPVPAGQLPVELPPVESYQPTGTGESPLAAIEEWVNVKCPTCPGIAKRETDTMPQWAGSSWYFLRFADPRNNDELAAKDKLAKWLPVDLYVGGAEHAVLHLLYARFWTKALHDAGAVSFTEPFIRLRNVGLVIGEDGQKMSKSRGNVVNPDDVIEQYGADALRLYEMFMGPFEASAPWDSQGIVGLSRFLKRVWAVGTSDVATSEVTGELLLAMHHMIKRVSEGTEQFKFNTAISSMMEFLNVLEKESARPRAAVETLVRILAPYAPHIAEELWQRLNHTTSLTRESWPTFDEAILARAQIAMPIQVNGKVRGTVQVEAGVTQDYVQTQAQMLENVQRHLAGKEIVNVVFVPDRLINFVTK